MNIDVKDTSRRLGVVNTHRGLNAVINSRVLFVEDDFIANIVTCEFLRDSGFNVISVYCADAAFEVVDKHERLSALVTDIDLGAGADGFDVARYARSADPAVPVVYVSGTAWRRQATEGVEESQFISKPFHPRQIVEALTRASCLQSGVKALKSLPEIRPCGFGPLPLRTP